MKFKQSFCCGVISRLKKIRQAFLQRSFLGRRVSYFCLFVAIGLASTQIVLAADYQVVNLKQSTACSVENFPGFFSAYADSETIQRAFLKTPLKVLRLDLNAEPEPKPVVRKLKYSQIKFPLLPLRAEREAKSLALRIDKWSEKKAEATLFKKDTGYQVTYFFVKNDCWALVAIEDWSM